MSDKPRLWRLLNPEQIANWIERSEASVEDIHEVTELLLHVLAEAPNRGIRMMILGGNPVYHELTASGRTSVTWSLLDEDVGRPSAVYIRQIENFDITDAN